MQVLREASHITSQSLRLLAAAFYLGVLQADDTNGLFDRLIPGFSFQANCRISPIATNTCTILVHALGITLPSQRHMVHIYQALPRATWKSKRVTLHADVSQWQEG